MITRFSVMPDTRGLILGVDKQDLFEPGYVYSAEEILDTIIIKKLGKWALPDNGYPSKNSEASAVIYSGLHLLTQEELNKINKEENEENIQN